MTFTLRCPNCGHALGNGYHQPDQQDQTKEVTGISLTLESDPPVKPVEQPTSTQAS